MISELQQFIHHADGTITVEGFPGLKVHTIEEQGRVVARDIERELGLPKYFEDWEIMAKPEGLSQRMVRFILMDQSVTRLQGIHDCNPGRSTFLLRVISNSHIADL